MSKEPVLLRKFWLLKFVNNGILLGSLPPSRESKGSWSELFTTKKTNFCYV